MASDNVQRDIRLEIEKQMWDQHHVDVPTTHYLVKICELKKTTQHPVQMPSVENFVDTIVRLLVITPDKLHVGAHYTSEKLNKMGIVPQYVSGDGWTRIYRDNKYKLYWSEAADGRGDPLQDAFSLVGDHDWLTVVGAKGMHNPFYGPNHVFKD